MKQLRLALIQNMSDDYKKTGQTKKNQLNLTRKNFHNRLKHKLFLKNIKQLQLHTFERKLRHSTGAWKQKPLKLQIQKNHIFMKVRSTKAKKPLVGNKTVINIGSWFTRKQTRPVLAEIKLPNCMKELTKKLN